MELYYENNFNLTGYRPDSRIQNRHLKVVQKPSG